MDPELQRGIDALDALLTHAKSLGLDASREWWTDEDGRVDSSFAGWVLLHLPNGRTSRRIRIAAPDAAALLRSNLNEITMLGNLVAFSDKTTGAIEAKIVDSRGLPSIRMLKSVPGYGQPEMTQRGVIEAPTSGDGSLILRAEDGRRIEIGAPSELASGLFRPARTATTIRIFGVDIARHDEALRALTDIANALFFDLDVLYGTSLALAEVKSPNPSNVRARAETSPFFPRNTYSEKALALYRYGRSAQGLPLLEFLAYYQSLEYFFPSFSHAETSTAMRTLLLDPRFNPSDDADVARLINTAAPAVRIGLGERDQLKSTMRSVLRVSELREIVESANVADHFTSKKQIIAGTSPLRIEGDDLREQLAERIYTIRCRIVHSKDDGGPRGEELLLPTSPEAGRLGRDIGVLRYVAQQAIIAQANR